MAHALYLEPPPPTPPTPPATLARSKGGSATLIDNLQATLKEKVSEHAALSSQHEVHGTTLVAISRTRAMGILG